VEGKRLRDPFADDERPFWQREFTSYERGGLVFWAFVQAVIFIAALSL
jgi:hypothetical protein